METKNRGLGRLNARGRLQERPRLAVGAPSSRQVSQLRLLTGLYMFESATYHIMTFMTALAGVYLEMTIKKGKTAFFGLHDGLALAGKDIPASVMLGVSVLSALLDYELLNMTGASLC